MKTDRQIYFFLIVWLISCNGPEITYKEGVWDGEPEYTLYYRDSLLLNVGIKGSSYIDFISNDIGEGLYQYISFYNDGTIKTKEIRDGQKLRQGRIYSFYKGSGCLSGDFMYKDNMLHGYGYQYFCNHNYLKKIFYYQYDELIYSEEYDEDGNIIEIFGDEPQL